MPLRLTVPTGASSLIRFVWNNNCCMEPFAVEFKIDVAAGESRGFGGFARRSVEVASKAA